jgi:antitoxin VapB
MKQTTAIFDDEQGQAVIIPNEFHFDSKEVWIRRDERTGEVILTPRLSWDQVFAGLDAAGVPDDFLTPEDRNQGPSQERPELFEDWIDDQPTDPSVK